MLDWSSYSETASPSHILVIVSGIAAGLVLTVLLVCLFVTCRRKVSCWLWILKRWQTMFPKSLVRRLGPFWFFMSSICTFLESWYLYPRNVYERFNWDGKWKVVDFEFLKDDKQCSQKRSGGLGPFWFLCLVLAVLFRKLLLIHSICSCKKRS